ncbi:ABC transporter permease [Streptomyces sp. ACA25]|uniref:ABC transporter permease n=1 Tax=Streptomyces sp. ACA25 TaxID=3022596 RepID=UPI002306E1A3|nr:ABC transporter permease [Streptomyces sp. ACA25]MDB1090058.1 ABC transporter permease [Streptomyces sp. ACA25]
MTQVQLPASGEPDSAEAGSGQASASQTRLVWRSFRRHKLAMAGAAATLLFILVVVFAEFLAPFSTGRLNSEYTYAPPQTPRFSVSDGLYVYGYSFEQDEDLRIRYEENRDDKIPLTFFAKGEPYKLLGVIPSERHLIGPSDPDAPMYLLGSDRVGRDQLSRLIHATRVSLSVGLVGVAFAFMLGVVLGGISGYFSGRVDTLIQRFVEFVMAVPTLPLWLGMTAAIPVDIGPVKRYFLISVILSLLAWTSLAREVRGRFLMLRQEDFVTSAWLDGASRKRVMFRHMLPSFTSHLIAALTLSIPGVILAETALSWLGLGMRPPVVSLGVLLNDATSVRVIDQAPWLLLPGALVVVVVLALNFVGDGLRDAADPYRT